MANPVPVYISGNELERLWHGIPTPEINAKSERLLEAAADIPF